MSIDQTQANSIINKPIMLDISTDQETTISTMIQNLMPEKVAETLLESVTDEFKPWVTVVRWKLTFNTVLTARNTPPGINWQVPKLDVKHHATKRDALDLTILFSYLAGASDILGENLLDKLEPAFQVYVAALKTAKDAQSKGAPKKSDECLHGHCV